MALVTYLFHHVFLSRCFFVSTLFSDLSFIIAIFFFVMFSKLRNVRVSSLFQYLSPAYAAALALIIIQAGIGVLYKFVQHDGG